MKKIIFALIMSSFLFSQDESLSEKLSNPVSDLMSIPFQYDYDRGVEPNNDGTRSIYTLQPVIPFSINNDWNMISRTVMSYVDINNDSGSDVDGFSDIVQSFFFTPKETINGFTIAAGPVLTIPNGSDVSSEKWGIGPTVAVLKQENGWTYGALANHVWSFAGSNNRHHVNNTFVQPFLAKDIAPGLTISLNSESNYDWRTNDLSVPINLIAGKIVNIYDQPVQFRAGLRYWAVSDDNDPSGFGARLGATLLFPK